MLRYFYFTPTSLMNIENNKSFSIELNSIELAFFFIIIKMEITILYFSFLLEFPWGHF